MKKFLIIILFFTIISCKNKSEKNIANGYFIQASIQENSNQKKVFLKTQEAGVINVLDSTIITNGKFEFKGIVDKPVVYGIFIDDLQGAIGLFMENENITIEAYGDSLSASKITGSKTNDAYMDFVGKSNLITSKMNVLFPEFQKARAENDIKKLEDINAKMRAINDENSLFALNYAKENPNSYIGAFALHSTLGVQSIDKDTIAKIYNNFSDYVKKGDFAVKTSEFLRLEGNRE